MNTDEGWVVDYQDALTPQKEKLTRKILADVNASLVDSFMGRIRYPLSAYRAHARARSTIPDGDDQQRYLRKLKSKIKTLAKHVCDVSELLEDAPFELRGKTRKAGVPITLVQDQMTKMLMAINDVEAAKSRFHPEIDKAVADIADAFREEILTHCPTLSGKQEIMARAFNYRIKDQPHASKLPLPERFVPLLAELLDVQCDYAYRLIKKLRS